MMVEAGAATALVTAVARTDAPRVNDQRPRGGTSTWRGHSNPDPRVN